jgi:DNA-binding transcriptional ArsR family regulator
MAAVELTTASRDMRRCLGPMAWAVLEDLALDARVDERGVFVAGSSARQVAANLDIQPGTAARALRCLRDAGLVVLVREPGTDGRFGLSAYQLAEIAGLRINASGPPCAVRPHPVRPHIAEPNPDDPHAVAGDAVEPAASVPAPVPVDAEAAATIEPATAKAGSSTSGGRAGRAKPVAVAQPALWETT